MNNAARTSLLLSTVAGLFAVACSATTEPAPVAQQTQAQSVKCVGINSCKGTSECQSSDGKSACQGQNSCKGEGFITVPSAKECADKGGTIYSAAPKADGGADGATLAQGKVKCDGINSCKGTGGCAGADNSCAGKNECKGKGWIEVPSLKECTDQGGKLHT